MNNWRSIETAPKDGTEFLGVSGKYVRVFRWYTDEYSKRPKPFFRSLWHTTSERLHPPTHWQPLPELPS